MVFGKGVQVEGLLFDTDPRQIWSWSAGVSGKGVFGHTSYCLHRSLLSSERGVTLFVIEDRNLNRTYLGPLASIQSFFALFVVLLFNVVKPIIFSDIYLI